MFSERFISQLFLGWFYHVRLYQKNWALSSCINQSLTFYLHFFLWIQRLGTSLIARVWRIMFSSILLETKASLAENICTILCSPQFLQMYSDLSTYFRKHFLRACPLLLFCLCLVPISTPLHTFPEDFIPFPVILGCNHIVVFLTAILSITNYSALNNIFILRHYKLIWSDTELMFSERKNICIMKDLLFNYWTMHSVIFLKTLYYNLELKITYVKYECVLFVKFILTKWYFYLCITFGKSLKRLTAFLQS